MRKWKNQFEYITHIKNLKSILEKGILSHNEVEKRQLSPTKISDKDIVTSRKKKLTPASKSLWDYANVYFRARNAMLFRMVTELNANNLVILAISPTIMNRPNSFITTGNAANNATKILPTDKLRDVLSYLQPELGWDWWKTGDDSKRKTMAECLVLDSIPREYIKEIYVVSHEVKEKLEAELGEILNGLNIIPVPDLFFEPETKYEIHKNLFLVEGDMFFSKKQTLTISVNTIGVMGKGLASRAKYQFPDVYVYYQELCKKKELKMGEPILYKRDAFIGETLSMGTTLDGEKPTWFLLFPTKTHFKYKSDLKGIENGLIWLKENYKDLEISSIALPALGCGLGWLSWETVGPIMVKHLKDLDIPVWIYLPREKKVEKRFLTKEFLLNE